MGGAAAADYGSGHFLPLKCECDEVICEQNMFGFGPGYAELLRPDEARAIREEKSGAKTAVAVGCDHERTRVEDGSRPDGSRLESGEEDEEEEEEAEEAFIRHVRFASAHRPLQRSCTIDTEADALAHGIDRQLFLEWTRYMLPLTPPSSFMNYDSCLCRG